MRNIYVVFNHRIDSRVLFDGFADPTISVIDIGETVYVIAKGNVHTLYKIIVECWRFAPFEVAIEEVAKQ